MKHGVVGASLAGLILGGPLAADAQLAPIVSPVSPVQMGYQVITSAQVLAAKTTPVAVLPAVAGYAYDVVAGVVELPYKSATYSSTACGLYYHGTSQLAAPSLNAVVDAAASSIGHINGLATAAIAVANINGLGVDFACTTADPTTGDSTVKLVISYQLVPTF